MPITLTKSKHLTTGLLAGLALVLIGLGLPPLSARLIELPGNEVVKHLQENQQTVSDADLAVLESTRMRVLSWFPLNNSENELALDAFVRAGHAKGEEATRLFAAAETWQRVALRTSPTDPYGWMRLAYLFLMQDGGPSFRTAAAWTQSMAVGPYEPELMISRLQMGMANYAFLTPEARAYIPLLVRGSATFDMDNLARYAKEGAFTSIVQKELANNEEELALFRQKISP